MLDVRSEAPLELLLYVAAPLRLKAEPWPIQERPAAPERAVRNEAHLLAVPE